jgi:leader peptidase (prepilin peptidase) / N-methyltransferase
MLLRGKCRGCKAPISPRYFIVELLTGLLFLLSVRTFGLNLAAVKYSIFSFLILGLIFTDADLRLLPDALTLPGIVTGILFSALLPVDGFSYLLLGNQLFSNEGWRILSLIDSIIGAAFSAFFIWAVGAAYKAVRHVEGMGFGDVKLMAMVGAFLGVKLGVLTIMAGSLMGSVAGVAAFITVLMKRRRRNLRNLSPAVAQQRALQSAQLILRHYEMPFGVFLGIAALGSAFFGQGLIHWYGGFFR